MPDPLPDLIASYLSSLARENASPHTVRNYQADLEAWICWLTPEGIQPPPIEDVDVLTVREWLASLYEKELKPPTVRRKLAALRSFFLWAERAGIVKKNVARLVRTPKNPQILPHVPTAETANNLMDAAPAKAAETERPHAARDLAILELLYGCGLRISELVGLSLTDLDLTERWLRVIGKGKKERQIPFGNPAAAALRFWLQERHPATPHEAAVFLNHHGRRLTDRGARNIVKFYSTKIMQDSSIHPHTFRHAYATHMLSAGADLRAIQELLGHARLSTTQKYTQVALSDLIRVYDKCHPKA